MPAVDLSDLARFERRNLWQPDGRTIAVRPGLRELASPTSGYVFIAGRSIKSTTSGELFHYVVEANTAADPNVYVRRFDEYWSQLESLRLDGLAEPPAVSFVPVGQEMLICGKNMPTVRCLLGGHMQLAERVESRNALNTTAIPTVPRGIGTAWKARAVIAAAPLQDAQGGLLFSDPGAPQTFVVQNYLTGPWASPVHGLHVSAQGALIVATETGCWAVPDGVVSAGQRIVDDNIGQIADVAVYDYNQTCSVRDTVWALTRRGIRQVWPTEGPELLLSEQVMPRARGAAITSPDFRAGGRIIGGDIGPMVAYDGNLFLLDITTGHHGWWTAPNASDWNLRGVLHDFDGDELLLTEGGVYRLEGTMDGGLDAASEGGEVVSGYFAGRLQAGPEDGIAVNRVTGKTTGHGTPFAAVNGYETAAQALPQEGAKEGVASWSDTSRRLEQQGLTQMRHPIPRAGARRAGEAVLEYGTTIPGSRILPSVEVDIGGSSRRQTRNAKGTSA